MSDATGSMHPVALCLVSHTVQQAYTEFLNDIKEVYYQLFQEDLIVDFVMMDAERAEWNAAQAVFPTATRLMCWFHVKKRCREKLQGSTSKEGNIDMNSEFY